MIKYFKEGEANGNLQDNYLLENAYEEKDGEDENSEASGLTVDYGDEFSDGSGEEDDATTIVTAADTITRKTCDSRSNISKRTGVTSITATLLSLQAKNKEENSETAGDEIFEAKSIVSQRPKLSKEQARGDKCLKKLTKRALEKFSDTSKVNDNDMSGKKSVVSSNATITSSLIRKKVGDAIGERFPHLKKKEANNMMSKNQSEVEAKAQLDALKRFIETVEFDVINTKRTARAERKINQKMDRRKEQVAE